MLYLVHYMLIKEISTTIDQDKFLCIEFKSAGIVTGTVELLKQLRL